MKALLKYAALAGVAVVAVACGTTQPMSGIGGTLVSGDWEVTLHSFSRSGENVTVTVELTNVGSSSHSPPGTGFGGNYVIIDDMGREYSLNDRVALALTGQLLRQINPGFSLPTIPLVFSVPTNASGLTFQFKGGLFSPEVLFQLERPVQSANSNDDIWAIREMSVNLFNNGAYRESIEPTIRFINWAESNLDNDEMITFVDRISTGAEVLAETVRALGEAYLLVGEYDNAIEQSMEVIMRFGRVTDSDFMQGEVVIARRNLGEAYSLSGQYDLAISEFNRLVDCYYNDFCIYARDAFGFDGPPEAGLALILNSLAFAYRNNGQYDRAIQEFMNVISEFSDHSNEIVQDNVIFARRWLGTVYNESGQYERALDVYANLIAEYRNSADDVIADIVVQSLYARVFSYANLGQPSDVCQALEEGRDYANQNTNLADFDVAAHEQGLLEHLELNSWSDLGCRT